MAQEACNDLGGIYKKFKPHLLMLLTQMGYTFLYFITEASFNHGMNPHVYITYRHIVAGVVMFPFAYVLERKDRPKLTLALFLELFVLSLLGVGLTLNMYFASLRYTSPTFLASMVNTIASVTFVIAIVLRLEVLNLRNPRGLAKVLGTLISLAGVMTMTLYKGPIAITLKRYPAQLSLTTWMSFIGAAQSAVFTGVVCSGLIIFIQLWCTEEKGPVFVTMFNPVSTILVAVLAYFVLGERLYTGSILGAFIVILGLYLLLWGKEGDEVYIKSEESSYQTTYEEHKDNNIQKITSAKKDVLHGEP
ncbi:unnamed protein product [Prunus armeniaca]|uniref:WAT1-related protein n=1 Tax=Prunus armeniaca TaxID=36596 RepID=A0A6J5VSF9_PRUAR|nr:unnamed protein product [Prunus armeniaca]